MVDMVSTARNSVTSTAEIPYRCDRVTGQCEGGCQVGLKGVTCDTRKLSFTPYMFISYPIKNMNTVL